MAAHPARTRTVANRLEGRGEYGVSAMPAHHPIWKV